MRVGETVSNTLKEGGIEKRGGEANIKKRGVWKPLTNYGMRH